MQGEQKLSGQTGSWEHEKERKHRGLVGGGLEKVGNHHISLEEIIRLFSDY